MKGSGEEAAREERGGKAGAAQKRHAEALLSSPTRVRIAELVSRRPRTLRELARLTGVSVPGVLRHVEAMGRAGLIREDRLAAKGLPVRKVYSLQGVKVMDFSVGDLTILKVSAKEWTKAEAAGSLERQAMDIMMARRRVRDKAKRLARAIDELAENEEALAQSIEGRGLADEERLVLLTVLTEETTEEAERVLARVQGMRDARRSIDKALATARRNGGR